MIEEALTTLPYVTHIATSWVKHIY